MYIYIHTHIYIHTLGPRTIGCLTFTCHFPQESPIIGGSFAEMTCILRHPMGLRHPVERRRLLLLHLCEGERRHPMVLKASYGSWAKSMYIYHRMPSLSHPMGLRHRSACSCCTSVQLSLSLSLSLVALLLSDTLSYECIYHMNYVILHHMRIHMIPIIIWMYISHYHMNLTRRWETPIIIWNYISYELRHITSYAHSYDNECIILHHTRIFTSYYIICAYLHHITSYAHIYIILHHMRIHMIIHLWIWRTSYYIICAFIWYDNGSL